MAYERIQCPKCPSSFGQEARFVSHLSDVHGVDDPIVLYLEIHHEGVHPTCSCSPSCPDRLPWSGWKRGFVSRYARGHNARVDSVYLDSARQAEFAAKRSEGFSSGKYSPWNKGLTKETSAKVEASSAVGHPEAEQDLVLRLRPASTRTITARFVDVGRPKPRIILDDLLSDE